MRRATPNEMLIGIENMSKLDQIRANGIATRAAKNSRPVPNPPPVKPKKPKRKAEIAK